MTAPAPIATGAVKLGPGTLKIGAVGSEIDVSCLLNSCTLTPNKNQGDSVTKLCGTTRPGAITYDYSLSGNIDVDIATAGGLFQLCATAPGTQQSFEWTPNNAAGVEVAGILIIDPLAFGGDTYGADMASDFEFSLVGEPVWTFPPASGP